MCTTKPMKHEVGGEIGEELVVARKDFMMKLVPEEADGVGVSRR